MNEEDKRSVLKKLHRAFDDLRNLLERMEKDTKSKNPAVQASAMLVSCDLFKLIDEFMGGLKKRQEEHLKLAKEAEKKE